MQDSAFITQPDAALCQSRINIATMRHALQAAALTHRPPPPEPTTCCGRGCNGCVWESWYAAMQYWQEQADQLILNSKP